MFRSNKNEPVIQNSGVTMKRLQFLILLALVIVILSYGSHCAFADGLVIRNGATLTVNGATLDLNCLDLTIDEGATLNLGSGAIEECGILSIIDSGDLILGTGTIHYCLGNIFINADPDSLNASWVLEGPSSYSLTGSGDRQLLNIATGQYTLTWDNITDWSTPAPNPMTKDLPANNTISFVGTYIEADSDGDGINDIDERAYWGSDWDEDFDSDGLINLYDPDSDNDGYLDGLEIDRGTDPSDPDSHPVKAMPWVPLLLLED